MKDLEEDEAPDLDAKPQVIICRDIPGDHATGRECFCCPGIFDYDDDAGFESFFGGGQKPS